ncbi:MAG: hypothetical protein IT478_04385 [Xanthomonadales bacterium]|nr:hypothetical protein [Xanthomonadales bacterium]
MDGPSDITHWQHFHGFTDARAAACLTEKDDANADGIIDLDRRVVFIHGVPGDTRLPSTVASLGPIPASVTLPIACGVIKRIK